MTTCPEEEPFRRFSRNQVQSSLDYITAVGEASDMKKEVLIEVAIQERPLPHLES